MRIVLSTHSKRRFKSRAKVKIRAQQKQVEEAHKEGKTRPDSREGYYWKDYENKTFLFVKKRDYKGNPIALLITVLAKSTPFKGKKIRKEQAKRYKKERHNLEDYAL